MYTQSPYHTVLYTVFASCILYKFSSYIIYQLLAIMLDSLRSKSEQKPCRQGGSLLQACCQIHTAHLGTLYWTRYSIFTSCISGQGNRIGPVFPSVCQLSRG